MAATGASLELRKLQAYPIPVSAIVRTRSDARASRLRIEVVLVLTGAGIGILRNPDAAPVECAWGCSHSLFNLVLGVGLARHHCPDPGAKPHPRGGFPSSDPVRSSAADSVHARSRISRPAFAPF